MRYDPGSCFGTRPIALTRNGASGGLSKGPCILPIPTSFMTLPKAMGIRDCTDVRLRHMMDMYGPSNPS